VAEERAFLKDYTVPFVQLDPMKTILCFSHEQNTFDKRKLLQNPHPDYVKESTKSVDDFIKLPNEAKIKKFFMEDVDKLLENYAPGNPQMKPDVLKQIAEIEANRDKMIREEMAKQGSQQIMLNQPGKEPVPLSTQQVVELLSKQGQQIQMYEHLLYADLAYVQSQSSGRLISRFTNDIILMRGAVSNMLVGCAKYFLSVVFLIIIMFSLEPFLSMFPNCNLSCSKTWKENAPDNRRCSGRTK
jgi:hypothetical protein